MHKNFGRMMLRFLGVVTIVIFVILIKIAMIIGPPLYRFCLFINSKRKKKEVEYGWDC